MIQTIKYIGTRSFLLVVAAMFACEGTKGAKERSMANEEPSNLGELSSANMIPKTRGGEHPPTRQSSTSSDSEDSSAEIPDPARPNVGRVESAGPTLVKPSPAKQEITIDSAKLSLDPTSCVIEILQKGNLYRHSLESSGPCSFSKGRDGDIRIEKVENGKVVIVGSSARDPKHGLCKTLLHGITITSKGPRLSPRPQRQRACSIGPLDQKNYAVFGFNGVAMSVAE